MREPKPYLRDSIWWLMIRQQRGRGVRRSLETSSATRAKHLAAMLAHLTSSGQWDVVRDILDGSATIAEVFQAHGTGDLKGWRERRLAAVAADAALAAALANDPDIEPYIERWHRALLGQRPKSAATYLRMVRCFLPADEPFRLSGLKRGTIRAWLDTVSPKSRNRYRTGLSSFCAYLTEIDVIEQNPVLLVKAAPERPPRMRYLTRDEAQHLVAALPHPHRALHALLLATGADVGGALLVKYKDVDVVNRTVRVPGSKAHTRDAVRWLTEPWAADEFLAYLKAHPGLPNALVFASLVTVTDDVVIDRAIDRAQDNTLHRLQSACLAIKVSDYSTRDHRHTYAVQALRDGHSYAIVAHQLGHSTTALVHKTYGRFIPNHTDFARVAPVVSAVPVAQVI